MPPITGLRPASRVPNTTAKPPASNRVTRTEAALERTIPQLTRSLLRQPLDVAGPDDDIDEPPPPYAFADPAKPRTQSARSSWSPREMSEWAAVNAENILQAVNRAPWSYTLAWIQRQYPVHSVMLRKANHPVPKSVAAPSVETPVHRAFNNVARLIDLYEPTNYVRGTLSDDVEEIFGIIKWCLRSVLEAYHERAKRIHEKFCSRTDDGTFLIWLMIHFKLPNIGTSIALGKCHNLRCRLVNLSAYVLKCLESWQFQNHPGPDGMILDMVRDAVKEIHAHHEKKQREELAAHEASKGPNLKGKICHGLNAIRDRIAG